MITEIKPCEHCGEKMTAGRLCDRCRQIQVLPGPASSRVISRVLDEVDASEVECAHFERLTWQEKVMVMMAIKMGYVASVREALDGVRAFRADVRGE